MLISLIGLTFDFLGTIIIGSVVLGEERSSRLEAIFKKLVKVRFRDIFSSISNFFTEPDSPFTKAMYMLAALVAIYILIIIHYSIKDYIVSSYYWYKMSLKYITTHLNLTEHHLRILDIRVIYFLSMWFVCIFSFFCLLLILDLISSVFLMFRIKIKNALYILYTIIRSIFVFMFIPSVIIYIALHAKILFSILIILTFLGIMGSVTISIYSILAFIAYAPLVLFKTSDYIEKRLSIKGILPLTGLLSITIGFIFQAIGLMIGR